jgi:nucleotide-binding universal stress UspA family protein
MSRIVVPLDESELAEEALPWAASLARTLGLAVHLVAVWTYDTEIWIRSGIDPDQAPEKIADALEAYLEQAAKGRALGGLTVTTEVRLGNVAEQLAEIAAEGDTRFIVITSHGRSGLRRLVQGSVADALLRTSPVPVLVVRAGERVTGLSRILVTVDGSETGERALGPARELAAAAKAQLHVLRAVNPIGEIAWAGIGPAPDLGEVTRSMSEAALAYMRQIAKPGEVSEVQYGRPLDVVIEYARDKKCDVIVMATHGRGGVVRLALGSTTDAVVRAADRPVLVVPAGETP